ncbi:hypothetical protein [Paraburkholderia sediminicola]|uniref:hypothetical protein n=1 Tax=Paraburkholderia sediminicola TaxID=458836 RepID=UPI0038BD64A8
MAFKFNLGDAAKIVASDEAGEVVARAEYASNENSYLLRYKSADGRAVESWWGESAVSAG